MYRLADRKAFYISISAIQVYNQQHHGDGNGEPNLVSVERKRFATVDEDEFQKILKEKDSVNTRRATDSAVRTLQAYLREKGLSENFEDLSKTDLLYGLKQVLT